MGRINCTGRTGAGGSSGNEDVRGCEAGGFRTVDRGKQRDEYVGERSKDAEHPRLSRPLSLSSAPGQSPPRHAAPPAPSLFLRFSFNSLFSLFSSSFLSTNPRPPTQIIASSFSYNSTALAIPMCVSRLIVSYGPASKTIITRALQLPMMR